ncbi:MAG: UUP1 family membrane protein [Thermodesulfobacteriota bacterium]|nr:UUP1 family membrane protein [Thermodesulfobacteriota bacterium]
MTSAKRNRSHLIVVFVFGLLFLLPAIYKIVFLKYPIISRPVENLWTFELKIHFQGTGKMDTISHFLPRSDKGQSVFREDFLSRELSFIIEKRAGNTGITWRGKRLKGDIQLFYRAKVQTEPRNFPLAEEKAAPDDRYSPYIFQFLLLGEELESINVELEDFLKDLTDRLMRKREKVRRIFDYLIKDVKTVELAKDNSLTAPIRKKEATLEQKKDLFIHLARMAGVPTRAVNGVFLESGQKGKHIHQWAEIYLQRKWIPVDIENAWFAELPETLLVLYRGDGPFLSASTKNVDYRYAISQELEWTFSQFYETAARIGSKFHEWSLFALPVETQQVFRLVLLIPLGALIVSVFRNVVGVNTFGTFMPVLIALAFRSTRLWWGLLLFAVVIALGLGSRWAMDRLKLLVVPRLSVIATMLVIILVCGAIIGQHIGVYRIVAAALFPMIIMTMTIERLSIILMERGMKEAFKVSFGTLVVALTAYVVMSTRPVEDFMFAFPESLFALIGLQIMLGRYTGYRVSEYIRFAAFRKKEL